MKDHHGISNPLVALLLIVVLVIGLGIGLLAGHSSKPSSQSTSIISTSTTPQTTTVQTTVTQVATSAPLITTISQNNTVVQVLYSKKTIRVAPPKYNIAGYNRVTGCYWIDGYYNFSFNAPYPGYLVFNETNDGLPTNFTTVYFSAYFSTEKPRYVNPSPYNGSYWCAGETVQSNVAPYVAVSPYNNQTMLIPIKNGTNYVIFYNGNANQQYGVNPFAINVTFNMKYYGFKNATYIPVSTYNFNATTSNIPWGHYP